MTVTGPSERYQCRNCGKEFVDDIEHIRWVRYAADCAERVLHLAGNARPQAEAAIRAARAWADNPTEQTRQAALVAGVAARDAPYTDWTAGDAARAAGTAAYATGDAGDAARAAAGAAGAAYWAVSRVIVDTERAWQAKRRRHYGLLE